MAAEKYDRVVSAALAETTSKFRLAEALALDIPPRRRGPTGDDEQSVPERLEQARQAVFAAGGEPKSVNTLADYRRTALWVFGGSPENFRWISGVAFWTHNEAMALDLSYEEFAANPRSEIALRREAGKVLPGPTPDPETAARAWTPEQQAAVVIACMAIPEVAAMVRNAMRADRGDRDPAERPAPTFAGLRVKVIEIKDRYRNILHVLRTYELADDGSAELLLGDLAEVDEVADQVRTELTGKSMSEALDEILSGGN